jgi:hypothetical protein
VGMEFIGVSSSVQRHPKVEVGCSSGRTAANTASSLVQRMAV